MMFMHEKSLSHAWDRRHQPVCHPNRLLRTCYAIRADNGCGSRRQLLAEAFTPPSEGHSRGTAPPQSHPLRLSGTLLILLLVFIIGLYQL